VPAADDRVARRAEAEDEPPRRELRDGAGRGGDRRRRADVHRRHREPDPHRFVTSATAPANTNGSGPPVSAIQMLS
jgi:hypothetical protein